MNGLWKRRVPAFLLTLVMIVSLAPAALAADDCPMAEDGKHSWGDWTVSKEPDCLSTGIRQHTCSACSQTEDDVIRALGHDFSGAGETTVEATCRQEGSKTIKCSRCDETTTVKIPKLKHQWGDWEVITEPTCTQAGVEKRECSLCGDKDTRSIDKEDHTYTDDGIKETPATCTKDGKREYTCSTCGQVTKTEIIDALGHTDGDGDGKCDRCKTAITHTHKYGSWKQLNSSKHVHECSICGATEERDHSFKGNTCETCGYTRAAEVVDEYTVTLYNGSSKTEYTVEAGEKLSSVVSNITPSKSASGVTYSFKGWTATAASNAVYNSDKQAALESSSTVLGRRVTKNVTYHAVYVVTATGQNISVSVSGSGGAVVGDKIRDELSKKVENVTGQDFVTVSFSSPSSSSYGTLYKSSSKGALGTSAYKYSETAKLYFVPGGSSGYKVSYTAVDGSGNKVSGQITISGAAAASKITCKVSAGKTVTFDRSDFADLYKDRTGGSLQYVEFTAPSDYTSYGEVTSGSKAFSSRSSLSGTEFYYSSSKYGDYPLNGLKFKADSKAKKGTLKLEFTAWGTKDDLTGTVEITVSGTSASSEDGDITYTVAPGGKVSLKAKDFNEAYRDLSDTSRTIRYVTFAAPSAYSGFEGKLYCGSKSFSKSDLTHSKTEFYYSDDDYGDYDLDELVFKADSSAEDGDELEITFRAYYRDDDYEEGTLTILIEEDGSHEDGDITYKVAPGGKVSLKAKDFNEAYRDLSDTSRTIRYVTFAAPSAYTSFKGKLYSGSESFSKSDLTHSKTEFYYSDDDYGDYDLDELVFKADSSAKDEAELVIPFRAYYRDDDYEEGRLIIIVDGDGDKDSGDIVYEVSPGKTVNFKASDFNSFFRKEYKGLTLEYVTFDRPDSSAFAEGKLYHNYEESSQVSFTASNLSKSDFYYKPGSKQYGVGNLTFKADSDFEDSVTLRFTAYGEDEDDYVEGEVVIRSTEKAGNGDISYTVTPGKSVDFKRTDFNSFFREEYRDTVSYVVFERPAANAFSSGTLYCGYGSDDETAFTRTSIDGVKFCYNKSDMGKRDYYLDDLSFVADTSFKDSITLAFTAYGEDEDDYVEGEVVIKADSSTVTAGYSGSIRYITTTGNNVQINANDIAQYYKNYHPTGTLEYAVLAGIPKTGSLYYNYYGKSAYGSTTRTQLTASNYNRSFYFNPSAASQFALSELTYVPSGTNYCAMIPFVAVGTRNTSVTGTILISVSRAGVTEVYGVTPKNKDVTFPASSINSAVSAATGSPLYGIQLLSLPAAKTGTIYVGSGTGTRADTSTVYTYSGGSRQIGQLRFVPASGFTGSVEIPYVAVNSSGTALASGTFSLGVLASQKKFSDVNSSSWCYKYVAELSDANIIGGYSNNTFRPNNTVTYGAALKLIMLAAGYPELAPVNGGGTFSGYLARAQADGIITRSNVNLNAPITRLQAAQLAAGALKLETSGLSAQKPFTDTADVHVQALNAVGIVGGYFSNGTSTYRPNNTLTRGQISAIVWRMYQYRK